MDIQQFIFVDTNLPFLIAGCIVLAIAILELTATVFGMSSLSHSDSTIDFGADLNGNGIPDYLEGGSVGIFHWANPSQIPLMIFLLVFNAIFSLMGFSIQWIYQEAFGLLIPVMIVLPITIAISFPLVRWTSAVQLQTSNKQIRTELERGIVDVESVKKANEALIQTINDTIEIAQAGKTMRANAEKELADAEQKLKQTLLSAADKQARMTA